MSNVTILIGNLRTFLGVKTRGITNFLISPAVFPVWQTALIFVFIETPILYMTILDKHIILTVFNSRIFFFNCLRAVIAQIYDNARFKGVFRG